MDWISKFRAAGGAEPADPPNETVNNGAPYDADKAIRSSAEKLAAAGDRQESIAEEIERQQISLAARYLAAVRAR